MLLKRYKSTEVDRRTWLHVPSGTPWSTSSDTHQVVKLAALTITKRVLGNTRMTLDLGHEITLGQGQQ